MKKKNIKSIIVSILSLMSISAIANNTSLNAIKAEDISSQPRNILHFNPPIGWMNDPNGLFYLNGEWHLFYQYVPESLTGYISANWGHAVSTDLYHWEDLEIAIPADDYGNILSGSSIVDYNNTSGLFKDGEEGIVSFYTSHNSGREYDEEIGMAYSNDYGRTFTKYNNGLPIIKGDDDPIRGFETEFRDPKVIWSEEFNKWIMVIAGGRLRIYSSDNLIDWTFESYNNDISTECPDLFPMKVEGTEEEKWVVALAGRYYVIGDLVLEGGRIVFKNETTEKIPFNFGTDSYAQQTFYNAPDNKRIAISWAGNWEYNGKLGEYLNTFNGTMTLPYEFKLTKNNNEYKIYQTPYNYSSFIDNDSIIELNETIKSNTTFKLPNDSHYVIDCEVENIDATSFGFKLKASNEEETVIYYDVTKNSLIFDRTHSGIIPSVFYANEVSKEIKLNENKIKMQIFVDTSIVEVIINDGAEVCSMQIFNDLNSDGLSFYSENGEVNIDMTISHYGDKINNNNHKLIIQNNSSMIVDGTEIEGNVEYITNKRLIKVTSNEEILDGYSYYNGNNYYFIMNKDINTQTSNINKTITITLNDGETQEALAGDIVTFEVSDDKEVTIKTNSGKDVTFTKENGKVTFEVPEEDVIITIKTTNIINVNGEKEPLSPILIISTAILALAFATIGFVAFKKRKQY